MRMRVIAVNPIRHTKKGWYWGSIGPQPTKEALLRQIGAIYASGYKRRNPNLIDSIHPGDVVIIVDRFGKRHSGKAVMRSVVGGWVLNMGGKHGTPALADESNIIWVRKGDSKTNPIPTNELFESFHQSAPTGVRKILFNNPQGPLVKIGRITRIEYDPEGNSVYNKTHFYHDAGDLGGRKIRSNAILATDSKGKDLFIIKEKRSKYPKFTNRGIIG